MPVDNGRSAPRLSQQTVRAVQKWLGIGWIVCGVGMVAAQSLVLADTDFSSTSAPMQFLLVSLLVVGFVFLALGIVLSVLL